MHYRCLPELRVRDNLSDFEQIVHHLGSLGIRHITFSFCKPYKQSVRNMLLAGVELVALSLPQQREVRGGMLFSHSKDILRSRPSLKVCKEFYQQRCNPPGAGPLASRGSAARCAAALLLRQRSRGPPRSGSGSRGSKSSALGPEERGQGDSATPRRAPGAGGRDHVGFTGLL